MAIKKLRNEWMNSDNFESRGERRRALYLGERVSCAILFKNQKISTEIIDLTPKGLAVVTKSRSDHPPVEKGDEIGIQFKGDQSWTLKGTVVNVNEVAKSGKLRIGIKVNLKEWTSYGAFSEALGSKLYECKTYIRPQITCHDPFFFNEIILFQVNGFTAHGIDVVVSSRWKSILPGQELELNIYVPGKGSFDITCINSTNYYHSSWKDRFRIYLVYKTPPKQYLEAISEYLVMLNNETYPQNLRSDGFTIGTLDHACHLSQARYTVNHYPSDEFTPSVLACPIADSLINSEVQAVSRELCCKLGSHRIAYFNLAFFEANQANRVSLTRQDISQKITAEKFMVLANLLVSHKANISDFLIPLLKQVIRIGAQSKSKHLVVEVDSELVKILKLIGFQSSSLNYDDNSNESELMILDINKTLANRQLVLDQSVWHKVYKDLSQFLGRSSQTSSQAKAINYSFAKR